VHRGSEDTPIEESGMVGGRLTILKNLKKVRNKNMHLTEKTT
jgi:hypothetical protein